MKRIIFCILVFLVVNGLVAQTKRKQTIDGTRISEFRVNTTAVFDSSVTVPDSTFELSKMNRVLLEDQVHSIDDDSFVVSFGKTFTDPQVVVINKNPWNAYIKTIWSDSVSLGIAWAGTGDSVKVDIIIVEE